MSEESHKIKTELFRFATLRKPKLIEQEAKQIGFVTNRDPANSFFLKKLENETTLESARKALPGLAKRMSSINKVENIRAINEKLYRFSSWLMQNRSHLQRDSLEKALQGVNALTNTHRSSVWDNLYAEIIQKKSPPIRHACIQMLIADHFVLHQESTDLLQAFEKLSGQQGVDTETVRHKYFRRLSHATVAVHYVFGNSVQQTEDEEDNRFPHELFREHDTFIRTENIRDLESVVVDLERLNVTYEKEKAQVFEQATRDYDKKIQEDTAKYNKANKLEGLNQEALNKINPDTLPDFDLPEFSVEYPSPLSESYLKDKVSPKTKGFVLRNKTDDIELQRVQKSAKDLVQIEKKGLYSINGSRKKRIKLAGKAYALNKVRERVFTIGFRPVALDEEGKSSLFMSICTGSRNIFVKSMRYGIKLGNSPEKKGTEYKERNRSKTSMFLELFPGKTMEVEDGLIFTFRAELELSDGQSWKLELEGQTGLKTNWSTAKVTGKPPRETTLELAFEGVDVYGVNRVGIADYRLVEQEVCCYVPGEVSHIENILAREYKERHTRSLTSTETTTESESQYEVENQTDTSTTERNELNTEIAAVMEEERSNSFGISTGVSGTYFGVDMRVDSGLDFATSNSSSDSNTIAKNYAVEVTKAATERVLQKTTEKRISKILQEYEENNRHGFDNRAGDQHVTGVYRWVDKIMTNRLVNYGKRLVYEFLIPEPSKFYRQAIEIQVEEEDTTTGVSLLEEPTHPEDLEPPIKSASDIERETYQNIAAIYGATVTAPKDNYSSVSESYASSSLDKKEFSQVLTPPIIIPAEYIAKKTTGTLTYDWEAKPPINDGGAFINITFGGKSYNSGKKEGKRTRTTIPNSFYLPGTNVIQEIPGLTFSHGDKTGTLTGSVNGNKLFSFNISLDTELELKPEIYEQWQVDTYEAIMSAYNLLKAEYDASLLQEEETDSEDPKVKKFAASMYRQLEQTELKRLAIEMLTKPFGIPQGRDFTGIAACGVPKVQQGPDWEVYSSHVKFFEQAFDWSIMSYLFYPYYWAKKCDWVELFQAQTGTDEIFSAFLQSGMARMTVPVRQGFEKAVIYYMATGDIWMGGDLVLETDDDLYLSVAEEMEVIEGKVEEEWQITLPTSLTVVQSDSVALEASGLPCCDDVDSSKLGLLSSDSKLTLLNSNSEHTDGG